ncbi:MAG: hypothetical protein JW892_03410 [Anaerolineae bacterium]|nr:hypothetical protein [Anaerolineae bacterium]
MSDEEYFQLIGAALADAEQGTSKALFALGDEEAFLTQDPQALFGLTWEDIKEQGEALWKKVSPKIYAIFCDPKNEEQQTLANLISSGSTEVAGAVAAILSTYLLGLVPAIAVGTVAYFIAKLVLGKFFQSAFDAGCQAWKATLEPES